MDLQRLWRENSRELISVAFYLVLFLLQSHLKIDTSTLLLLSATSFFALLLINGSRFYPLGGLLLPPGLFLLHWLSTKWPGGESNLLPLTVALFFLHLAIGGPRDERAFARLLFTRLNAIGWAIGFTLASYVIFGPLLFITLEELFNLLTVDGELLMTFVIGLLLQLALLALLHFRHYEVGSAGKVCRWIGDRALITYSLIIYCYIGKILLQQRLPNSEVALVLLPYLVGVLHLQCWHRAANEEARTPFARLMAAIYRRLNWLNLAPLAVLMLAIQVRLDSYGLTPLRIHLLVFAGLLTLANGLLLLPRNRRRRFNSYQLIIGLLAATALVDGYLIPHDYLSNASQHRRLERLLKENDLLRAGQVDWAKFAEFSRNGSGAAALIEISAAHRYLAQQEVGADPFGLGSYEPRAPAPVSKNLTLRLTSNAPLSLPPGGRLLVAGSRPNLKYEDIRTANPAAVLPSRNDWQRHFEEQLKNAGLNTQAPLDSEQREQLSPRLFQLEFQGQIFVTKDLELLLDRERGWQVDVFHYDAYIFNVVPN